MMASLHERFMNTLVSDSTIYLPEPVRKQIADGLVAQTMGWLNGAMRGAEEAAGIDAGEYGPNGRIEQQNER